VLQYASWRATDASPARLAPAAPSLGFRSIAGREVAVVEKSELLSSIPDRTLLIAIFNAITGLAEKLTGERIVVFIPTEAGDLPYQGVPAAWQPIHPTAVAVTHDAHSQSEHLSRTREVLQE
jgi:hypothetical protein